ncbi:alginate o-acetyltransferase AlgJ [Asticcacaulis biprosthecium C19]|uniref:Probable alginate O-acetylase AlgJ n=1 Tax=Asticcacaulis biprosthecium C19 TaxID=715226 RepID=F4QTK8_9CAUL|nr:alginate O-acetyltransferase [Asticcacaulis biprosthecium]EGF90078.1 alginate o-acetyltransferase AlgJ [Asticcacaulis biprosthecium C19]
MQDTAKAMSKSGKPAAVLGVVLGAALLTLGLANPAMRGEDAPALTFDTVFHGKWAEAFSAVFDKKLLIRDPSTHAWTAATYGLFHEGRDGVLAGTDSWLFTKEEFEAPRLSTGIADTVAEANSARQALDARGVRLVIAIVPAKARIYGEHLGGYRWPAEQSGFYDALLSELRGAGFTVVDLRPSLLAVKAEAPAYFRTDTHWTPAGAQAAAQTIAAEVEAAGGIKAQRQGEEMRVTYGPAQVLNGDLMTFLPLGTTFAAMAPPADSLSLPAFAYVETGSGGGDGAGDLLGDSATPVILVGTSYSADERWGFAKFLEKDLGADLVNVADKGAGPFVPMDKLLTGGTLAEAAPELVIWEIPERYVWMRPSEAEGGIKQ